MVCRPLLPCGAQRSRRKKKKGNSGEREAAHRVVAAITPELGRLYAQSAESRVT